MKFGKTPAIVLGLALLVSLESARAQMWGTGMSQAAQSCPYELKLGDEATSIKDEIEEQTKALKELKSELSKAKSKLSSSKTAVSSQRELFRISGFDGDAFSLIDNHITGGTSCSVYERVTCNPSAKPGVSDNSQVSWRMPANVGDGGVQQPVQANPVDGEDVAGSSDQDLPPLARPSKPSSGQYVPPLRAPTPAYPYPQPGGIVTAPAAPVCGSGGSLTDPKPFAPEAWARACGPGNGSLNESICSQQGFGITKAKSFNPENCRRTLRNWVDKARDLRESESRVAELDAQLKEMEAYAKAKKTELREALKERNKELREQMTEGGCVECMLAGNGNVYQQRRASGWEVGANVVLGLGSMYLGNQLNKYQTDQNARLGFPTQSYPSFGYGLPYFSNALYGAIGGGAGHGAFGCSGGGGMGGMGGAMGYPMGMGNGMMNPMMGMNGMNGLGGMMNPMMGMNGMGMPGMGMGNGMGMGLGMGMPGMGMGNGMGMGFGMGMPGMGMGMNGMGGLDNGAMQMQMQMQQQMAQMQMQQYQQYMQMQQQQYQSQMARQQVVSGLTQELYTLMYRIQAVQSGVMTGGYGGYLGGSSSGGPSIPGIGTGGTTYINGNSGTGGPPSLR